MTTKGGVDSSVPVTLESLAFETELIPPEDFSFPFEPYGIQKDFMKALFTAMEQRKLGIFESPTGTGKSLSLLCGSLTWLEQRDEERLDYLRRFINGFDVAAAEVEANNAENWIVSQSQLRKKKEVIAKANRELKFLEELKEKRKKYLQKRTEISNLRKPYWSSSKVRGSAKPPSSGTGNGKAEDVSNADGELDDLILNDDYAPEINSDSDADEEDKDEEPEFYPNRIFFASRTHSQLSQFANELKRTSFATKITAVSLGSRQNLCVNSEVKRLKNLSLMNERCLDLQKQSKGKKTSETKKMKGCAGCEYFNHSSIEELKSQILSEPMDIEDLTAAGKDLKACPYYASRKASKEAQLVLLPYNTILHSGTRDGIGLKMENASILLDEAHNLIESISNMYSNHVSLTQLEDCSSGLKVYLNRYMSRFSAKNLLKLKQIGFVMKSIIQFFGKETAVSQIMSVQQFKIAIGIENLDLYDLLKFIQKSKLVFKLKGYMLQKQKIEIKTAEELSKAVKKPSSKDVNVHKKGEEENVSVNIDKNTKPKSGQSILNFVEFIKSLLTFDTEGRIIVEGKAMKFLLLNTSDHFQDLIKSARSIILAGGTMKPYDEIEDMLFQSSKSRISHFSCNHVIPDQNLVCLALKSGPSSTLFDFTYKNRSSSNLMEELCRSITNLSKIIPGGLVCFLPSYDYESTFYAHLKESGAIEKIQAKKKIFREPKDSNCEKVLTEYSRQIKNNPGGAMLFAVVGGKLSEGINFSDDLGRCVIVVGLPYPNIMSLEIKEKVRFASDRFGQEKGSQLLTTMCSKAVNQSIGRAIRHSADYAAIILIDHRFAKPNQISLLPDWILKRFSVCDQFGQAVRAVSKFFNEKKTKDPSLPNES